MKLKFVLILVGIGILIVGGIMGIYAQGGSIKYTPSTETHCDGDRCYKVLYSGTRFVEEDNVWKRIENARSLKDKEGLFWDIEIDPSFNITIGDYDYNSFENLCFSSDQTGNIPLKVYRYSESNQSQIINEIDIAIPNPIPNQVKCYNITLQRPIFNYWVKWGLDSTTIQLQDNVTENLKDTYTDENNGDINYGSEAGLISGEYSADERYNAYIMFNISSLPLGVEVDSSDLYLYEYDEWNCDSNDLVGLLSKDNHTWNENSVTWNSPVSGDESSIEEVLAEPELRWFGFNVTDWVSSQYESEVINLSFKLENPISNSLNCRTSFYSKEHTTASLRPYLNITYTEAAEGGGTNHIRLTNRLTLKDGRISLHG